MFTIHLIKTCIWCAEYFYFFFQIIFRFICWISNERRICVPKLKENSYAVLCTAHINRYLCSVVKCRMKNVNGFARFLIQTNDYDQSKTNEINVKKTNNTTKRKTNNNKASDRMNKWNEKRKDRIGLVQILIMGDKKREQYLFHILHVH